MYDTPTLVSIAINMASANQQLLEAAEAGDVDAVKNALAKGANIEATSDDRIDKQTALIIAAQNGRKDVVQYIISQGGNIEAQDVGGYTALMYAARSGYDQTVKALLSNDANVNTQSKSGYTALMLAAYEGHDQIVKTLLSAGANMNTQNSHSYTALMGAAEYGYKGAVEVLISHGADISITNNRGLTALDLANKQEDPDSDTDYTAGIELLSNPPTATPTLTTEEDAPELKNTPSTEVESPTPEIDTMSKSQFDDAMEAGFVTINVNQTLMCGIAGAGKTCTRHIILNMEPPVDRSSTPLADSPIHIRVRDISGVKVQAGESGWKVMDRDDLQNIVTDTISSFVDSLDDVPESTKQALQQEMAKITATSKGTRPQSSAANTSKVTTTENVEPAHKFQGVIVNIMGVIISDVAGKSREIKVSGRNPADIMGSNWIYFTDSGGQPHFHNLMPHFVRGISAALFVFRLSERLDEYPVIEYFENGKPISASFLSPLTTEDTLKNLVHSMQGCSVNEKKPTLAFLGTFADKMHESSETLQEKNAKLLKQLMPEFYGQLAFFNEADDKLIFAVDARHLGDQQKEVARLIRSVIERSPSRQINVPMWWYVVEIILEKLTLVKRRKVLSKAECLEAARYLNFSEEALLAALDFFHKQNIFHYFPDVLPEVVFCSPQVLLDKLTELIKDAYIMRDSTSSSSSAAFQIGAASLKHTACVFGDRAQVRDKGIVTLEFLKAFPQHYVDGLFSPRQLIDIFKKLLILTPMSGDLAGEIDFDSSTAEYYMPSLLDILPSSKAQQHRVVSDTAAAMLFQFPSGCSRAGVFCCLQVYLIQVRKWNLVLQFGKPKLIQQNIVILSFPKRACVVTLIDSFSYFEVHVKAQRSVCRSVCPLVCEDVLRGIEASCERLKYSIDLPQMAFFCPCDSSLTTLHAAIVLKEDQSLECTVDQGNYYPLQAKHDIWLTDSTLNQASASTSSLSISFISALQNEFKIADEQIDRPIEERDLFYIGGLFGAWTSYVGVPALGLSDGEQHTIRTNLELINNQQRMLAALKVWQHRNPLTATFRNLLSIVLELNDVCVAKSICQYISKPSSVC